MINNHFQTLDVARTATDREIEAAYKKLKLKYKINPIKLKEVEVAFAEIGNPIKRKKYLAVLDKQPIAEIKAEVITPDPLSNKLNNPITITGKHEPNVNEKIRTKTELFDDATNVSKSTLDVSSAISKPDIARTKTEFFDGAENVTKDVFATTSNVPKVSITRTKTEFFDSAENLSNNVAATTSNAPKASTTRTKTEFFDNIQNVPSAKPNSRRSRTEYFEDTRADSGMTIVRSPTRQADNEISNLEAQPITPTLTAITAPYAQLIYQNTRQTFQLHDGENWIGRADSQRVLAISIDDPQQFVSRAHAVIYISPAGCWIEQHGGNASYLNANLLMTGSRMPIQDGDIIGIEGRQIHIMLKN